jgi:DNA-binding NarL/FixJ family response regulator
MKLKTPKPLVKSRILVADEQSLLREGVVHFINRQDDLLVCGEADNTATARTEAARLLPDMLLLDLRLGSGDTIDLIKDLKIQHPSMAILVFSQFDETLFAEKVLRAGAMGYVLKQEATDEVLTAVRTVLNGSMYVSRQIAVLILQKSFESPVQAVTADQVTVEKLSDRQLHVFQRLGAGVGTRQIAAELKLSVKTIETHRENIKHKLGLGNGDELVERATDWVNNNLLPNAKGGE